MRLGRRQIERIVALIVSKLEGSGAVDFGDQRLCYIDKAVELVMDNFQEEDRLNEEAERLLRLHEKKLGVSIDKEKALAMIRKQLAREWNFVL